MDIIKEKSLSPSKLRYLAEVEVFKRQHGGLEEVRSRLGFSRRKMAQLLLVDPSAWTRWCKDEGRVPAHVYRSLEWYLALMEKTTTYPELASVFQAKYGARSDDDKQKYQDLKMELLSLKAQFRAERVKFWLLLLFLAVIAISIAITAMLSKFMQL